MLCTYGPALLASIDEMEHVGCFHPCKNNLVAPALRHTLLCSLQDSPAQDVRAKPPGQRRWSSGHQGCHSAFESSHSPGGPRQKVVVSIRWQWLVKPTKVGARENLIPPQSAALCQRYQMPCPACNSSKRSSHDDDSSHWHFC